MTRPRVPRPFARFARDARGAVSVETMIILPALIGALMGMAALWDTLRMRNASLKAAVTISDAISRETAPIDDAFIGRMDTLFAFLTGGRGGTALRFTVVENTTDDAGNETMNLRWSAVTDPNMLPVGSIDEIDEHIPAIALGDHLIVVESWTPWTGNFESPIADQTFYEITVSRPRFVGQVLREGELDGLEGTDEDEPGGA